MWQFIGTAVSFSIADSKTVAKLEPVLESEELLRPEPSLVFFDCGTIQMEVTLKMLEISFTAAALTPSLDVYFNSAVCDSILYIGLKTYLHYIINLEISLCKVSEAVFVLLVSWSTISDS